MAEFIKGINPRHARAMTEAALQEARRTGSSADLARAKGMLLDSNGLRDGKVKRAQVGFGHALDVAEALQDPNTRAIAQLDEVFRQTPTTFQHWQSRWGQEVQIDISIPGQPDKETRIKHHTRYNTTQPDLPLTEFLRPQNRTAQWIFLYDPTRTLGRQIMGIPLRQSGKVDPVAINRDFTSTMKRQLAISVGRALRSQNKS